MVSDSIDRIGNEASERYPVTGLSKQKIVIRSDDADRDDNASDFKTISFKGLRAGEESVMAKLDKLA